MINVSLLFQDKGINNMDLSDLSGGNPGIGGTEYLFVILCKYLCEYNSDINLTIYHFNNNKLPGGQDIIVSNDEEAFIKAAENPDNIFIMKNLQNEEIYSFVSKYKMKYLIWCHNFLTYGEMKFFAKEDNIRRVICVGRQMYDYYIDEPVINKMDSVFNYFEVPAKNKVRKEDYELNVTYVGSLIYQKSFHVLAAAWKDIVSRVPEARLNVVGTGKLYNRENVLGKLGVAEESYEEMFLQYLTDDTGKVLDSVKFHGLMGDEKFELYENTAVGVVNPLSSTETFCLCAVELESVGIPVVSRKKNGLLDTVIDGKTGILYKDVNNLKDAVIKLLLDRKLNDEYGENAKQFAAGAFLPKDITAKWLCVISEINDNQKAKYRKPVNHMDNNGKRLRKIIHGIHRIPFLKWIPSIHDLQKK